MKGLKMSEKSRKKMSLIKLRNPVRYWKNKKRPEMAGVKNKNWKGDGVGYVSLHIWVRKHYGPANKCEQCGTNETRMYYWHNVSGNYLRNIKDWEQLCAPCHRKRHAAIRRGEYQFA